MATKVEHFVRNPRPAARPAAAAKSRMSIEVDKTVLARLKALDAGSGRGLQSLIDEALSTYVARAPQPTRRVVAQKNVRPTAPQKSPTRR